MKVAIIGSGVSGLSAASRLLERNNCSTIDVYEAASKSGGRISSFNWQLKNNEEFPCDTGQHFSIGAYKNFIELLERCDALKYWTRHSFEWNLLKLRENEIQKLLHFEISEITFFKKVLLPYIKFVKVPTKFFFLKFYFSIFLLRTKLFNANALCELYDKFYFSDVSLDLFWNAFAENSMNTEYENADLNTLSFLVNECMKDVPGCIDILLPKSDYYSCAISPIEKNLRSNGVNFFFNSLIENIQPSRRLKYRGMLSQSYDKIVLAVPGYTASKIWMRSGFSITKESLQWENQKYRHILNLWVIAHPIANESKDNKHKSTFFSWNPIEFNGSFYVVVIQKSRERPNLLSIIKSACNNDNLVNEEKNLMNFASLFLQARYAIRLEDCEYKLIRAKRATIACTADQGKNSALWSGIETGISGIFKCSDEASLNFPSTIEGAVKSGYLAAESI